MMMLNEKTVKHNENCSAIILWSAKFSFFDLLSNRVQEPKLHPDSKTKRKTPNPLYKQDMIIRAFFIKPDFKIRPTFSTGD